MNVKINIDMDLNEIFNQKFKPKTRYAFDDLLIIPSYSSVLPADTNISTKIGSLELKFPVFSSAMDTVSESAMGIAMAKAGGCAIIHKNLTPEKQASEVKIVKDAGGIVGAAIGTNAGELDRAKLLIDSGADTIVIDTAHGHSESVGKIITELRKLYPNLTIIGGNIATGEAALYLRDMGASAVKVGMGPGSICTTRTVTGTGVPQAYAIFDVARALNGRLPVIADGGIKQTGDAVKALALGASAVMIGSMVAGTDEAPGEVITNTDGTKVKNYRGMGSKNAMKLGSETRYNLQGMEESKRAEEGVDTFVRYKGPVEKILNDLEGALRQGFGYSGAATILDLWIKAKLCKMTPGGLAESHPHIFNSCNTK